MLDLRAPLIPICAVVGLTLGAAAWLAAGRQDVLTPAQDRLAALGPSRAQRGVDGGAPSLSGPPLFALSTGPNAVRDPVVTVLGLSRMPGRAAALLAIDGKPPAWLARGESRDGVVLRDVGSGRASLDLPLGVRTLRIGEATPVSPSGATASLGPSTLAFPSAPGDVPPPGFRPPPPPASAPGLGG
ncbi:hypothetical protein ASD21_22965 [Caulobacter sp. Root1455]|uniref:hypothetical protein n=1 Tax=unclassified Caulobacter TaxID=2648921 RepID=UPI00070195AE|nr:MULTISPECIES: hypothetical protein [unclassified Caulobacter]KQY31927.1 hypothetical protein ASD38_22970 [Caulobacter sp. Root487D2Y]KQY96873.1 hypothetical protein ASD21_22965 [Caulobacter sp. Root1455]